MHTLQQVAPWGRSFAEYCAMFALTAGDLGRRIIDCGGGPASFNAELAPRGTAVSCDPLYRFPAEVIETRIRETAASILQETEAHRDRFVWRQIRSVRHLRAVRMQAMRRFLDHLLKGRCEGRYVAAALPDLPFRGRTFDLALCSHLLFTYSRQLSLEWHLAALREMARVAAEARIFPLVMSMTGETSPHLAPLVGTLRAEGYDVRVERVSYEFQKGGNEMLRIWPTEQTADFGSTNS